MANANTAKLGLSIWAPDDPLTRAEFNADHQKLEDALGPLCRETILDTVTTAAASSVDIPLGDVDWSRYRHVYVLHDAAGHASSNSLHRVLANGAAGAAQSGSFLQAGSGECGIVSSALAYAAGWQLLRLDVWNDPDAPVSLLWKSASQLGIGSAASIVYRSLTKLTVAPVAAGVTYAAGIHVRVWGVRG